MPLRGSQTMSTVSENFLTFENSLVLFVILLHEYLDTIFLKNA